MVAPLSSSSFGKAGMSAMPSIGSTIKTPVMPSMGGINVTPVMPNMGSIMKTPVTPNIGMTSRTPVAPNLGAKNVTPINNQQFGAVNKSSVPPSLPGMSLKGQSLGITKAPFDPNKKSSQIQVHEPVAVSLTGKTPELFHGSGNVIKSGEEIKPTGPFNPNYVYATRDLPTAAGYAQGRTNLNPDKTGNYAIFGTISGVKPSNEQVFKDISEHGKNTDAYVSKKYISTGPTHLVDYTGKVTPLGSNKPVTTRGSLKTPRSSSFEQGKLDFGNWNPAPTVKG